MRGAANSGSLCAQNDWAKSSLTMTGLVDLLMLATSRCG